MERRVSVNGKATSGGRTMTPDGLPTGWSEDWKPGADDLNEPDYESLEASAALNGAPGQGPCLYLGPAGQRCSRPALANGFCAVHQPGGRVRSAKNSARVLAAASAIAALLWPYLEDLVREILRWTHSH